MSSTDAPRGEVVVYQSTDGHVRVDVRLANDTVWLSIDQMAELFGRDNSVIGKHLRRIFADGELSRDSVAAKNAATASDGKTYEVEFFNLDAILSVGYRVNSRRGTQFRIWATRTLRDHLVRGFTLHERRLHEIGLRDAQHAIALFARTLGANALVTDEGQAVVDVVQHYARTWHWLFEYDDDRLPESPGQPIAPAAVLSLAEARAAIGALREWLTARGEAGNLFGRERDGSLAGLLGAIEQTFDGQPLYRSAQERAAHMLYFVVKDHPFTDGNKRIGALLFLEYLRRNGLLRGSDGQPRLPDTATAALTILIAESRSAQKDLMVRLVLSLLGDGTGGASIGPPSIVAERRIAYGLDGKARSSGTLMQDSALGLNRRHERVRLAAGCAHFLRRVDQHVHGPAAQAEKSQDVDGALGGPLAGLHLDEQVDVAVRTRVSASAAPEENDAPRVKAVDDAPRDLGQQLVGDCRLDHRSVRDSCGPKAGFYPAAREPPSARRTLQQRRVRGGPEGVPHRGAWVPRARRPVAAGACRSDPGGFLAAA